MVVMVGGGVLFASYSFVPFVEGAHLPSSSSPSTTLPPTPIIITTPTTTTSPTFAPSTLNDHGQNIPQSHLHQLLHEQGRLQKSANIDTDSSRQRVKRIPVHLRDPFKLDVVNQEDDHPHYRRRHPNRGHLHPSSLDYFDHFSEHSKSESAGQEDASASDLPLDHQDEEASKNDEASLDVLVDNQANLTADQVPIAPKAQALTQAPSMVGHNDEPHLAHPPAVPAPAAAATPTIASASPTTLNGTKALPIGSIPIVPNSSIPVPIANKVDMASIIKQEPAKKLKTKQAVPLNPVAQDQAVQSDYSKLSTMAGTNGLVLTELYQMMHQMTKTMGNIEQNQALNAASATASAPESSQENYGHRYGPPLYGHRHSSPTSSSTPFSSFNPATSAFLVSATSAAQAAQHAQHRQFQELRSRMSSLERSVEAKLTSLEMKLTNGQIEDGVWKKLVTVKIDDILAKVSSKFS